MTAAMLTAPVVTKRVVRRLEPRPVVWLDFDSGAAVTDLGAALHTGPQPAVGVLLERTAPGEVVNLTGGRPGVTPEGFHAWLAGPLPTGWTAGGHYLKRADTPILRFAHTDGRAVEIQRATAWFGDGDYSPLECAAALELVAELVGERWGPGAMRVRPAATGLELLLRMVPRGGLECPDDEVAALIRSTSGQGRIEHNPRAGHLERLVEYDGRFMYAALCKELPQGRPVRGPGDGGFDTMTRGRFRCEWRVPDDWAHLGLLPMMGAGGVWLYPSAPGERGAGWVDAVEVDLARRNGWAVTILEHLVWPDRGRPLDSWAAQLIGARDAVDLRAAADRVGDKVAGMARAAVRAICLFGLGAFYAGPYMVTHTTPLVGANVPTEATNATIDGDTLVYQTASTRGGPALAHPEWPATVWARCRVRMLHGPGRTGALHVPFEHVVAIHTDALYLTDDPRWADDGNAGRLRHKATWPGPHPTCGDDGELMRLVRRLRGGGDDGA